MSPGPPTGDTGSDLGPAEDLRPSAPTDPTATSALALDIGQLKALSQRLLAELENERHSLSRELHDELGQAVTAIKLCSQSLRLPGDTVDRAAGFDEIAALADHSIARMREMTMRIRPPQLDSLGLAAALRWQVGALFRERPETIALNIATLPKRANSEVELACFRIAQEGLSNCIRHGRANTIRIALDHRDLRLHLSIHDDGCGFPANAHTGTGTGIDLMRLRAHLAGGTLVVESSPGWGTRIIADLPVGAA